MDTGGNGMEAKTTALAAVKQEVRLQEWSAQIEAQQASGLTVRQWCLENGVKPKTYYYHLKNLYNKSLQNSSFLGVFLVFHIYIFFHSLY